MKVSPFAPTAYPDMPDIPGLKIGTAEVGIKYSGRDDVTVFRADAGTTIAGVFTKNACPGAPVDWSRAALAGQTLSNPKVIVVTAGNSNVFTGAKGRESVQVTADAAAEHFGGQAGHVFIASTGVIGEVLPPEGIVASFPKLKLGGGNWPAAAAAILTTDTYSKYATRSCKIDQVTVTLNGIAKGSGMIAPDMATMLAFAATDAAIPEDVLQTLLTEAVGPTFNAVTVDSDTSTSDTLLLLATGKSQHGVVATADDPRLLDFRKALKALLHDLALMVVKDGEGASKFVTINVTGAISDISARAVAMSVANSPLVKTAIAGEDANWGRIVMAVGKAGEPADRDLLTVSMGEHVLAEKGELSPGYQESAGAAYIKGEEIVIGVDLGLGHGAFTAYTCDLTHGYISINADYRS